MNVFEDLQRVTSIADSVKSLVGRVHSDLGIVLDNQDPQGYGRVKIRYGNGQVSPDWVPYVAPWFGVYPETLPIGVTVFIQYIQGDPAKPVLLGVLVNQQNPPPEGTGLRLKQEALRISASEATLENKTLATLGAKDTRNDTLVLQGWP